MTACSLWSGPGHKCLLGFLCSVSSFPMQHDNAISFPGPIEKHLLANCSPERGLGLGFLASLSRHHRLAPERREIKRDVRERGPTSARPPSRGENLLSSGKCLQSDAVSPLSAGQVIKLTRVIAIYGLTATTNVTGSPRASGCT